MKRIHIAIIMTMVIGFTGCNKTEDNCFITPTFSDALLSVEIPEPAPIEEPEPVDNIDSLNEGSIGGEDTVDSETSQDETNETPQENQDQNGSELETVKIEFTDELAKELAEMLDYDELSEDDIVFFTDPDTNNGQGYDYKGKHYETLGEKQIARFLELHNNDHEGFNVKTNKEMKEASEAMQNGYYDAGTIGGN